MSNDQMDERTPCYTEEEARILQACWNEKSRSDYWKAMKFLFTKPMSESNPWHWCLGCLLAMILRRDHSDKDKCWDYCEIGYFDYRTLYAGWEATIVSFNHKTLRYHICNDGDWNM